jgi:Uncharacterized alpha/beta hydrolase domain (DUF2235)
MSRPPPSVRASQVNDFGGPPVRMSQGGSLVPPGMSQGGSLAPPGMPMNGPQPLRGSSIFQPHPSALSRPQSRVEPPPLSATAGPMPGTLERPIPGPQKRLIVTCDGTWLDSDNGLVNGQMQPPSNVSRIGWAMKETSRDGIPQVVHYQAGVGSIGGAVSRAVGGATGAGLKENVREAYSYIAINWREGDEIFLIGFSRGAFTARSVAGMIGSLGLLTRAGLPHFSEIFEDFEHRYDDRYVSKFPNDPFPEKGPFNQDYVNELARRGLTRPNVLIKAVAVWDTVGSLGIPRISWLERIGLQSRNMHYYTFYDTRLHPCIENAFQALALDEHRAPFSPALWEKRDGDRTNLKQVWFPGVHSNVGGGYDDQDIANITLAWMMSRLWTFIDFHPDYIMSCYESNKAYYRSTGQKSRSWSFGEIYNSMIGVYSLGGGKTRTPGNYYRTDPITGRPTNKKLKNTNEYIHASVRSRLGLQGPGVQDRGIYEPKALRDWTFAAEENAQQPGGPGGEGVMVVWTNRSDGDGGGQKRMPEAVLLETERRLLERSPRVEEYVRDLRVSEKKGKRRSRRPKE